jgi:hypothetical protein
MERVVAGLKQAVGAGGEAKTVGYAVSPRYREPRPNETGPIIDGYIASNTVRVRTADIGNVGRLVDLALQLGANEVQRLVFTLADPAGPQAEALQQAAARARARAEALAASLGLRITGVVSATEAEGGRPVPFAEARMAQATTPVEPGTLEVQARTTMVFSVAPR